MPRLAVAVAALLLVSTLTPTVVLSSAIDDIIYRHWVSLAPSDGSETQSQSSGRRNIREEVHVHHNCDHEERQRQINHQEIDSIIRESSQVLDERPKKRASQAFGSLRVGSNTTLLASGADVGYACYSTSASYITSSGATATCTSADIMSSTKRTQLINNVIPAAIDIIYNLLQVDQPAGNLFLDSRYYNSRRSCNQGIPIPASYVQGNVGIPGVDYFVWVTARPANAGNLASALACNTQVVRTQGPQYGRPLAGYINFNPSELASIDLTNQFKFDRYVRVAVHELMHALGFSSFFYNHYVDDNGQLYSGVTQQVTMRENPVTLLQLPRVRQFAQAHYNCSSLTGMELEDDGGTGTAGSHWELRLANNEIMTGFADLALIISNLTLAMFRDMGWYRVNWNYAETFYLGYGQGCGFALNKCNTWTQPRTFCTSASARGCTVDRRAKGYCDYETGQSIPTSMQYFSDPTAGGNPARDYCSFIVGYTNTYCADATALKNSYETVGVPDSRCFDLFDGLSDTQGCLRFRCNGTNLELLLGASWVACNGATVNWPSSSRVVTCDRGLCNGPVVNSNDLAPLPPGSFVPGPTAGIQTPSRSSDAAVTSVSLVIIAALLVVLNALLL